MRRFIYTNISYVYITHNKIYTVHSAFKYNIFFSLLSYATLVGYIIYMYTCIAYIVYSYLNVVATNDFHIYIIMCYYEIVLFSNNHTPFLLCLLFLVLCNII